MVNENDNELLTPLICQISRMAALYMGREMTKLGLGPGLFVFLMVLYREEGLSQDELSRRVSVDKSNTSRALGNLEKYGLIRRERDAQNHRIKKIYLEKKAHDIKKEFTRIQSDWDAAILTGFSGNKKAEIRSILKGIMKNADALSMVKRPAS